MAVEGDSFRFHGKRRPIALACRDSGVRCPGGRRLCHSPIPPSLSLIPTGTNVSASNYSNCRPRGHHSSNERTS